MLITSKELEQNIADLFGMTMSDKELASGADSDLGAHFKILLMGPLTPKGDISPINVLLDYYYPTIKNEMYRAYKDVE